MNAFASPPDDDAGNAAVAAELDPPEPAVGFNEVGKLLGVRHVLALGADHHVALAEADAGGRRHRLDVDDDGAGLLPVDAHAIGERGGEIGDDRAGQRTAPAEKREIGFAELRLGFCHHLHHALHAVAPDLERNRRADARDRQPIVEGRRVADIAVAGLQDQIADLEPRLLARRSLVDMVDQRAVRARKPERGGNVGVRSWQATPIHGRATDFDPATA